MKPRFVHDCNECVFIEPFDGPMHPNEEVRQYDLYFHPATRVGRAGTVMLRFGNEGYEYASSDIDVSLARMHKDSLLLDAARRVLDLSLVRIAVDTKGLRRFLALRG